MSTYVVQYYKRGSNTLSERVHEAESIELKEEGFILWEKTEHEQTQIIGYSGKGSASQPVTSTHKYTTKEAVAYYPKGSFDHVSKISDPQTPPRVQDAR